MNLPNDFWDKIDEFKEILDKFNSTHNLTKYNNLNNVVIDSITPLEFLKFAPKNAIDIGSGAGFPAIFLAMILKDTSWYLYEKISKKSSFLTYVKTALKLENVNICPQKIEDSPKFISELITSRAVAKTNFIINICNGFFDQNSTFLLYKGSNIKDEKFSFECISEIYKFNHRNYLILKGIRC